MKIRIVIKDEAGDKIIASKVVEVEEGTKCLAVTDHKGVTERYSDLFEFIDFES